jgi:hypothetical protein
MKNHSRLFSWENELLTVESSICSLTAAVLPVHKNVNIS